MSVATLLLELVLAAAGAFGLRQRRHWLFVLALAAGAVGALISVGQYVSRGEVRIFASWDLVLAPSTAVLVLAAFAAYSSPRRHNRNNSSPVATFDRELYNCLSELGDILSRGPSRRDHQSIDVWTRDATDRGASVLRRLQALEPPTSDWTELLTEYIDLARETVAAIPYGVTLDERKRLSAKGDDLARRYTMLRTSIGKEAQDRPRPLPK